ncbi:MAG: folylpolyglutamate synthase/dihydrofolate synthase family protein [Xenococcaceae cyanobacterium MO_188.B32]|nr:folylpolyglutamate synthase/dihydrofolate synthase family protein [Xenococcaceae cyanobacterium MO_188.B32]
MTVKPDIDSVLQPFQYFGVHLGLKRIERLLADLDNPHDRVPIIHVGGTNGKGSVCAYLSSILTEAGYRVGRYTSPHLVDWTERICLNERPIEPETLANLLQQIKSAIDPTRESPTQFEVITAAAWLYFAQSKVDIAVMEVGLGGRLDATNVCDRPLISIITSISKEHWQRLGPTVADIAREKAGILKANCPAVIGKLPPEAREVVTNKIKELNCPATWVEPAEVLKQNPSWAKYQGIEYPLPLPGEVQLTNSALAIAACQILQQQGWNISTEAIQAGMSKTRWLARLQWTRWKNLPLLIDGAHNPAAAGALRNYVDSLNVRDRSIIWVMGILSTKDHQDIFTSLLRPKNELHLVPVPDCSTADPEELANLARQVCPQLSRCQTYADLFVALDAVWQNRQDSDLVILCGSLYLIGYFFKLSRITVY